jgi:transcriptional regulator with XRE-family HTH domain
VRYIGIDPPERLDLVRIRQHIGYLIRELRLQRGMTQAALAWSISGSRSQLSRIERGHVLPPIAFILRIAAVLGVEQVFLRLRQSATQKPSRR